MQSANYDSPLTVQGNSSGEAIPVTGPTGASSTTVQGPAASDAAVVGNPLLNGGRASSATPTAVSTNGDAVAQWLTLNGAAVVAANSATGALADAASNTVTMWGNNSSTALASHAFGMVYNGTTWDRLRGTTAGLTVREIAGLSASAAFTPAASSHTNGDVNGGAQTFDLNAPASCMFRIDSVDMLIAGGTIETTVWTLHLFNVTPPSAIADDGAFTLPAGDRASYLGFITIPQVVDYVDSLYIQANVGRVVPLAASGDLFAYLVNETTLTPQAVTHTVRISGKPV